MNDFGFWIFSTIQKKMKKAIVNARIYTGEKIISGKILVFENGIITAIQKNIPKNVETIDLSGFNISAGFIDTHINGGEKYYLTQHPTEETIHDIYTSSLKYGTTHVLPCLITSPLENILKGIEVMKNYKAKYNNGVLGMHLEGPFISPAKRGAHLLEYVRTPTNAELEEIIKYGKDVIRIMTIAPEVFTDAQLDMLLESGITISAGHSNMTYKQAQYYFSKGIKLVTHLYNAMNQFGHREPGLVGAVFQNENVYAPIILDGFHCDYAAAAIAHQLKKEKLFLISDALFLSRKVKQFNWGTFDAQLREGSYRNSENNLAGAAISMAEAVSNAVQYAGFSLEEAINAATIIPAKAIGMSDKIGKIAVGYPASFTKFSDDLKIVEAMML